MQWEYLTTSALSPWDETLNTLGAEGWELVAVLRGSEYRTTFVFKRPAPEAAHG